MDNIPPESNRTTNTYPNANPYPSSKPTLPLTLNGMRVGHVLVQRVLLRYGAQ